MSEMPRDLGIVALAGVVALGPTACEETRYRADELNLETFQKFYSEGTGLYFNDRYTEEDLRFLARNLPPETDLMGFETRLEGGVLLAVGRRERRGEEPMLYYPNFVDADENGEMTREFVSWLGRRGPRWKVVKEYVYDKNTGELTLVDQPVE